MRDWADVVLDREEWGHRTSDVSSWYEWEHCPDCGTPAWACARWGLGQDDGRDHEIVPLTARVEGEREIWRHSARVDVDLVWGGWRDDAQDVLPADEWRALEDRLIDEDVTP